MITENNVNKLRSDATWSALTSEQRETIERWLFEENLSFREIEKRATSELGLAYSKSAIGRLYKHLRCHRTFDNLTDIQADSAELNAAGADLVSLRSASRKLISARLLEKAMEHADTGELCKLGRLMLQTEDREIQRDRADLARERFQFKASQAALKVLPMLDEMNQEEEAREIARVEKIKLRLFGSRLLKMIETQDHIAPAPPKAANSA
jgi:hypothetical protein